VAEKKMTHGERQLAKDPPPAQQPEADAPVKKKPSKTETHT
jgi:hypothetical protein